MDDLEMKAKRRKKIWAVIALAVVLTVVFCFGSILVIDGLSASRAQKQLGDFCDSLSQSIMDGTQDFYTATNTRGKVTFSRLGLTRQRLDDTDFGKMTDAERRAEGERLNAWLEGTGFLAIYITDSDGKVIVSTDSSVVGKQFEELLGDPDINYEEYLKGEGPEDYGWVTDASGEEWVDYMSIALRGVNRDKTLLIKRDWQENYTGMSLISDIRSYLRLVSKSTDASILTVSYLDTVSFFSGDESLQDKPVAEVIPSAKVLEDRSKGIVSINGTDYNYFTRVMEGNTENWNKVIALRPVSYLLKGGHGIEDEFETLILCTAVFVLMLLSVLIYGLLIEKRNQDKKRYRRIVTGITVVAFVLMFAVFNYVISLCCLRDSINSAKESEELVCSTLNNVEPLRQHSTEGCEERDVTVARTAAIMASGQMGKITGGTEYREYLTSGDSGLVVSERDSFGNPVRSYPDSAYLKEQCSTMGAAKIYILDDSGYQIASSNADWRYIVAAAVDDADAPELKEVLYRQTDSMYRVRTNDDGDVTGFIVAVPIEYYAKTGDNGLTNYLSDMDLSGAPDETVRKCSGVYIIEQNGAPMGYDDYVGDIEMTLGVLEASLGCSVVQYTMEEPHEPVQIKRHDTQVINPSQVPFNENMPAENNSYNYFSRIAGKDRFVHVYRDFDINRCVACVYDQSTVYTGRLERTLWFSLLGFVCLTAICAYLILNYKQIPKEKLEREAPETVPENAENGPGTAAEDGEDVSNPETEEDEDIKDIMKTGFRKARSRITLWKNQNPESRFSLLMQSATIILALILVILTETHDSDNATILKTLFSGEWEKGFTFVNISVIIVLLVAAIMLFNVIRRLVEVLILPMPKKVRTYVKVAVSLAKYVLMFVILFYGAFLFGFETKSIATLAAVLTGVLGIGSQSLISDISSGFMVLAEGKVAIGDRVSCAGKTGVIEEIGIRTSSIRLDDGNLSTLSTGSFRDVTILSNKNAAHDAKPDGPAETPADKKPSRSPRKKREEKDK